MNFVDGRAVESEDTFAVHDPSTGEKIADVARSGVADVEMVVASANSAFAAWANLAAHTREKVLLDAAAELEKHSSTLTDLLVTESGSCITKARYEAEYTPRLLRAAAGEATRLYGETLPNERPTRMSIVVREPLGVVRGSLPFNPPLS